MTTRRLSRLLALLALAAPACGPTLPEEEGTAGTAGLSLPLSAAGADGSVIRLLDARFHVAGPVARDVAAAPEDAVVALQLPAGDYRVELLPGWRLERVLRGAHTPFPATLQSGNPIAVTVSPRADALARFRFRGTGGDVVLGGAGRIVIGADVEEAESVAEANLRGDLVTQATGFAAPTSEAMPLDVRLVLAPLPPAQTNMPNPNQPQGCVEVLAVETSASDATGGEAGIFVAEALGRARGMLCANGPQLVAQLQTDPFESRLGGLRTAVITLEGMLAAAVPPEGLAALGGVAVPVDGARLTVSGTSGPQPDPRRVESAGRLVLSGGVRAPACRNARCDDQHACPGAGQYCSGGVCVQRRTFCLSRDWAVSERGDLRYCAPNRCDQITGTCIRNAVLRIESECAIGFVWDASENLCVTVPGGSFTPPSPSFAVDLGAVCRPRCDTDAQCGFAIGLGARCAGGFCVAAGDHCVTPTRVRRFDLAAGGYREEECPNHLACDFVRGTCQTFCLPGANDCVAAACDPDSRQCR